MSNADVSSSTHNATVAQWSPETTLAVAAAHGLDPDDLKAEHFANVPVDGTASGGHPADEAPIAPTQHDAAVYVHPEGSQA